MPISTLDIAWLAGILEGEGSFIQGKGSTPAIFLGMNDKDVVEKAAAIVGAKSIQTIQGTGNRSTHYRWQIGSTNAIQWCMTIYTLMGERRKARIRELIADYKSSRHYRKKNKCGHPDRRHFGNHQCRQCHARNYYVANRAKVNADNLARYFRDHEANKAKQAAYRMKRKGAQ